MNPLCSFSYLFTSIAFSGAKGHLCLCFGIHTLHTALRIQIQITDSVREMLMFTFVCAHGELVLPASTIKR
jgi:hypothetical protein